MDQDFRELEQKESVGTLTEIERARLRRLRKLLRQPHYHPNYEWAEKQIYKLLWPLPTEGYQESTFDNPDNFRVARVDNEHEMLTFEAVREKGCCGSHEWEVVDPDEVRWILGFNYGH